MRKSVFYWLTAAYRGTGLADDALPSNEMQDALRKLTTKWEGSFQRMGVWLARSFASGVESYSDKRLNAALRDRGMTVKFIQTEETRDALQAVINENIGLIKSIPEQCLSEVQGLVMRSVARGRDLGSLTQDLEKRFKITRRRAAFIARDQNNKATSVMAAARQQQLGIDEGVWKHSHAGKTPRPSHVEADGKRFKLNKGMYLDGKWVMPGEEPNCRCTWEPVLPSLESEQ